jgi:hypothetical protein
MIKLFESQMRNLVCQPESGMGYQTVEVDYKTERRKGTVFNAELLVWEQESRTVLVEAFETLLNKANVSEAQFIKSIMVVSPPKVAFESAAEKLLKKLQGEPATAGTTKRTTEGESFARFTAYKNDRRITPNKGLRPGTYATTEADAKNVKTGSDAVERYALPDPKPAIYRFKIEPLKDTIYRQGVVQPAFGHKGGGIEVIFDNGTDDKTVTGLVVLPP